MLVEQLYTLSILIFRYWTLLHGPETTDKKDKSVMVNFRTLSTNPVPIFVLQKAILQLLQQYIRAEDNWMYFYKSILLTLLKRSCEQQRLKKKTSQLNMMVVEESQCQQATYVGYFHLIHENKAKGFVFFLSFSLQYLYSLVIWSLPTLKGDAILLHLKDVI